MDVGSVFWAGATPLPSAAAGGGDAAPHDTGYALADALIATLLLASILTLGLQGLQTARLAADMAAEYARASALLAHLIETAPLGWGPSSGSSDGFQWRVETMGTGAERPVAVCRSAVSLHNVKSGRRYQAATLQACPPEEGR